MSETSASDSSAELHAEPAAGYRTSPRLSMRPPHDGCQRGRSEAEKYRRVIEGGDQIVNVFRLSDTTQLWLWRGELKVHQAEVADDRDETKSPA